ncbi:MAG: hypothetical protein MUF77_06460 [Leptospira sp.]|jgi:hypothetical protein|nr:hypothetical protein [Leptospira sp.]
MIRFLGLCFFSLLPLLAEVNPWNLRPDVRILSRKEVSHMVVETRVDHVRLTLIVSERFPYNYKMMSFPLYFRLEDEKKALELANQMDKYLDSGKAFTITLNGSEIQSLLWGEP